jgi:hypothetical protein
MNPLSYPKPEIKILKDQINLRKHFLKAENEDESARELSDTHLDGRWLNNALQTPSCSSINIVRINLYEMQKAS